MPTDLPRLQRVLGGPDTEWLVNRLRERVADGRPLTGSVRLDRPSAPQRAAIDRLLGRRPGAAGSLSVSLEKLDAVLVHAGIHTGGLATAVVALTGPVAVRAETAAAAEQAWTAALAPAAALTGRIPELAPWWERVTRTGIVRRAAGGDPARATRLVEDLVTVLSALPVERELLAVFAARTLGHAHRLDPDRPVTGLVLSALQAWADLPADDLDRRTAWSSAGIVVDELSSRVLTLGLSALPGTALGDAVNWWRSAGEPMILSLRLLTRTPPVFTPGTDVFVCENPTVLAAAADRLGPACAPLICTEGQPGAAVTTLLDQLTATGARLHYHGDFDWYGIAIANFLHRRYAWRPWRFTAADYLSATPAADPPRLQGVERAALWDAELAGAMSARGIQVEEEHVLDDLLVDLARVH
ncbi:TIGR02679 family protein [Nocardia sp. NPDC058497]|uniref:TIGR02679 family protein n=1 Tax=Nocardia sp. NPDC058497 TaxID=3346529 RepID=UPI003667E2F8